jgi:alpha-beta hydrolase superfamily lysophospholipase
MFRCQMARTFVALVLSVGIGLTVVQASSATEVSSGIRCSNRTISVNAGLAGAQTIAGTYCLPAGQPPDRIMVMVPGASYNRTYWDFPYEPQTYSFIRAMARQGIAGFAMDRMGTGASSKPLSVLSDSATQSASIHGVISFLRSTGFDGHAFDKVLLTGHSLGSTLSITETGAYNDADGVVITGMAHELNLPAVAELFADNFRPADLYPQWAGRDPGYLTTQPGAANREAFYTTGYDPAMLAVDDATRDAFSTSEAGTGIIFGSILSAPSDNIKIPVLLVQGGSDQLICAASPLDVGTNCASSETLQAQEAPSYSSAPCLSSEVFSGVGHDVTLSLKARHAQDLIANWSKAVLAGECPQGAFPTG